MNQAGVKTPQAYYYAHVLEAMRARQPCATCGRGSGMTTAEIMDAIARGRQHTTDALHAAEKDGHVTHRKNRGKYIWRLVTEPAPEPGNAEADRIIREVASDHDVSVTKLTEPGDRTKSIVRARTCAIHRLRNELDLGLKEIGTLVGLKDHSSVHHHLAKTPAW